MTKVSLSKLGSYCTRHPDNRHGQGSPAFWEAEYRLWGVTRKVYHETRKSQSPKCPICGTPHGYSFGTGDCGCQGYE